ncbi:MAG: biotin-dependent carboxyltransferase family protein [Chitinophagaceae bacterium]
MLQVIKPGLLDTIQDAGRKGFAAQGINVNGPMDAYAMQTANALVGNDLAEAVIEMHFPAASIQFDQPALVAFSGADFDAAIDDADVPPNKPVLVPPGAVLHFRKKIQGARIYLAVHGGFALTPWLNSVATNLVATAGGATGKKLAKGDTIALKKNIRYAGDQLKIFPWRADTISAYMDAHYFYFIKGPEWGWLSQESQHLLLQEPFTIAPQSDRMAIRLQGEKMVASNTQELVSAAVTMGTIQLLPSGGLLVLMADHQTTGGYPRVGTIISAHLPKLAQAEAGDYVHLLHVEQRMAEELFTDLQNELKILQLACSFKLQGLQHLL